MVLRRFFVPVVLFLMVVLVACGGAGAEPELEPTAVVPEVVEQVMAEETATAEPAPEQSEPEPTDDMGEEMEEAEPTAEPVTEAVAMSRSGAFGAGESGYVGAGTATLATDAEGNYLVTLSEDFAISNGPDLYVVLSPAANPMSGTAVGEYLKLDDLQSTNGSQSYAVPPGTDVSAFQSVVIYCEAFSVVFSSAPLP